MRYLLLLPLLCTVGCADSNHRVRDVQTPVGAREISGVFAPSGPPTTAPERTDAGGSCVVDLVQAYDVTGSLSGSFEIDFRILVEGPCGEPAGTYKEAWIALGAFRGTVASDSVQASLTYRADVTAGGDISGEIVFGDGAAGRVWVEGNFSEGRLRYAGWFVH